MVRVSLSNKNSFLEFARLTLENVVVQGKGRCLFPTYQFEISDMSPKESYKVSLALQQVGDSRMYYVENSWKPSEHPSSVYEDKSVEHSFGIADGEKWMEKPIEFSTLRITNNENNDVDTTICLNTHHKYMPVLSVYPMTLNAVGEWEQQHPFQFSFEEAAFVAVTKYMNNEMKTKKIIMNKFSGHHAAILKRKSGESETTGNATKRRCDQKNEVGWDGVTLSLRPLATRQTNLSEQNQRATTSSPSFPLHGDTSLLSSTSSSASTSSQWSPAETFITPGTFGNSPMAQSIGTVDYNQFGSDFAYGPHPFWSSPSSVPTPSTHHSSIPAVNPFNITPAAFPPLSPMDPAFYQPSPLDFTPHYYPPMPQPSNCPSNYYPGYHFPPFY